MKRTLSFEIVNDKKIFQILAEPDVSKKRIVIMSHGFRSTSIGPARTFVNFEKLLLKENFSILRFDQPCSGNSDGDYVDSSFNEWVKTTTYFAKKYLDLNYQVVLMGQSMGATTTMIVAGKKELKNRIPCVILWVPDAKSHTKIEPKFVDEEEGEKYKNTFWIEAKQADFFKALSNYSGGIHLVYGDKDKYVSEDIRKKTIEIVKNKNQPYMILKGQDHSPWKYVLTQKVYQEEINFLKKHI